jgi:hypothetical protein
VSLHARTNYRTRLEQYVHRCFCVNQLLTNVLMMILGANYRLATRMAKRRHPHGRIVGILLFPIIVLLWALGWGLFWTGSKKQPPRRTHVLSRKEDGIEIGTLVTEEIQEPSA